MYARQRSLCKVLIKLNKSNCCGLLATEAVHWGKLLIKPGAVAFVIGWEQYVGSSGIYRNHQMENAICSYEFKICLKKEGIAPDSRNCPSSLSTRAGKIQNKPIQVNCVLSCKCCVVQDHGDSFTESTPNLLSSLLWKVETSETCQWPVFSQKLRIINQQINVTVIPVMEFVQTSLEH